MFDIKNAIDTALDFECGLDFSEFNENIENLFEAHGEGVDFEYLLAKARKLVDREADEEFITDFIDNLNFISDEAVEFVSFAVLFDEFNMYSGLVEDYLRHGENKPCNCEYLFHDGVFVDAFDWYGVVEKCVGFMEGYLEAVKYRNC